MVQEEAGLNTKTDRSLVTTADFASQAVIYLCVIQLLSVLTLHGTPAQLRP